jgi:hypothetical protein
MKYDVGVGALLAAGLLGIVFVNLATGLVLIAAAPVLAFFVKDRVDAEYRKRAKELGPQVLKQVAEKVGPKMDEMIDDFAAKLDQWVVTAGEELQREVLEVLHATRTSRAGGAVDEGAQDEALRKEDALLAEAAAHVATLRKSLWTPEGAATAGEGVDAVIGSDTAEKVRVSSVDALGGPAA